MEKQTLKTVLKTLLVGDVLNVTFLGDKAQYSGDLTVVSSKTGRGKGGSILMELRTADGTIVATGTPDSNNILNVTTADGTFHGYESKDQVPVTYEPNKDMSKELRTAFLALVAGQAVTIEATEPEFNGDFTVLGVSKCRGRGGQLQAALQAVDGSTVNIMSHRHSGLITNFVAQPVVASNDALSDATEEVDDNYIASVLAGASSSEDEVEETVTDVADTEATEVADDEIVAE